MARSTNSPKVYRVKSPFIWNDEPYNDRSQVYAADHPAVKLMGNSFEEIEVITKPSQQRPPTIIAEPEVAEPEVEETTAEPDDGDVVEETTAAPGEKRHITG